MSGLRWLLWRQHVLHGFPYRLHCVLTNTHAHTQIVTSTEYCMYHWIKDTPHRADLPPQIFSSWQDRRRGSSCEHGYLDHSLGGAPEKYDMMQSMMWGKMQMCGECVNFTSTHLDDVCRNDKLGRFAFTLFARWPGGSQPKDPLHLVPESLLTWLLIHGPT